MDRLILITAFALLASTPIASAQESPADLAKKLGSSNYLERETASKKLEAIGSSALPALRSLMMSADLETKRRAFVVMERIEDRTLHESVAKATPMQYRFQQTRLSDALHVVARQTRLRLPQTDRSGIVTLDTGVVPYWRAWREFCRSAQLEEWDHAFFAAKPKQLSAVDSELLLKLLRRNPAMRPPYVASTPPIDFTRSLTPHIYSEDDRHSVRVRVCWYGLEDWNDGKTIAVFAVELRPEARIQITAAPRAEITKILDADGREVALKPARRFPDSGSLENDVLLAGYTGESQYGGLVNLKSIYWQGPMRPLKEVHGKVKLEASVRPVAIEMAGVFDKIGQAARGHDGVTLKILQADRAAMKLRVQFDNVEALTPQSDAEKIVRIRPGVIGVRGPMDVVLERLELQGPHGWPCKRIESSYARAEDGKGYMATLTFEPPSTAAQDLTLVLTKAARTVPVEIPFLVRDVQVPRKQ